MRPWLLFTFLTLMCWGLYGFLPKLATRQLSPPSAMAYYLIGGTLIGVVGLLIWGQRPEFVLKGAVFAGLTGAAGVLGGFFYLAAVSQGRLAVVVTATALYPLVTILLGALFLQEPITAKQALGIILALLAMVLMAS